MSELRIVRGNTFFTRSEVIAKNYEGVVIDDFDLGQATDIKVNVKTEYKTTAMKEFYIDENYINIKWKGLSCGRYGLEVSGIYNGIEWRFYNRFVLAIVESNADANIPEDCIIREDYYSLDATTLIVTEVSGGGGTQEQSDWEEDDSSKPSYIKNKPTIPSIEGLITQEAADARYARIGDIPTKVSELTNDAGYLTSHQSLEGYATEQWVENQGYLTEHQSLQGYATETWVGQQGYLTSFIETDPTVPSWAKQPTKPSYTASEVGALPDDTPIPDAQIQSDWNQSDDTAKDYIKNKPTIPAAQVQSDWNASSGMGAILNKPTIPTVPANVSAFTNDAGYITSSSITNKANKITIVNYGTSSTTTTLSENIYYIWGEVASLTLTLGAPADASKLSEYMFEFQSGATPTTLSLPSSVKWVETPTIEANKIYQVSIVNDIAIIVGV